MLGLQDWNLRALLAQEHAGHGHGSSRADTSRKRKAPQGEEMTLAAARPTLSVATAWMEEATRNAVNKHRILMETNREIYSLLSSLASSSSSSSAFAFAAPQQEQLARSLVRLSIELRGINEITVSIFAANKTVMQALQGRSVVLTCTSTAPETSLHCAVQSVSIPRLSFEATVHSASSTSSSSSFRRTGVEESFVCRFTTRSFCLERLSPYTIEARLQVPFLILPASVTKNSINSKDLSIRSSSSSAAGGEKEIKGDDYDEEEEEAEEEEGEEVSAPPAAGTDIFLGKQVFYTQGQSGGEKSLLLAMKRLDARNDPLLIHARPPVVKAIRSEGGGAVSGSIVEVHLPLLHYQGRWKGSEEQLATLLVAALQPIFGGQAATGIAACAQISSTSTNKIHQQAPCLRLTRNNISLILSCDNVASSSSSSSSTSSSSLSSLSSRQLLSFENNKKTLNLAWLVKSSKLALLDLVLCNVALSFLPSALQPQATKVAAEAHTSSSSSSSSSSHFLFSSFQGALMVECARLVNSLTEECDDESERGNVVVAHGTSPIPIASLHYFLDDDPSQDGGITLLREKHKALLDLCLKIRSSTVYLPSMRGV